jgi:hypothetical protein
MLKYRADRSEREADGAVAWFALWMGGPSLSKIENCRSMFSGDARVTAFITGEPDTYFSIPAVCSFRGCRVRGYVTRDDEGYVFHHCYY